jgi:hypothetical protein
LTAPTTPKSPPNALALLGAAVAIGLVIGLAVWLDARAGDPDTDVGVGVMDVCDELVEKPFPTNDERGASRVLLMSALVADDDPAFSEALADLSAAIDEHDFAAWLDAEGHRFADYCER